MCVCACVRACMSKLHKLLVCLICKFYIFNNCSLSSKIYNVMAYCGVVNVQLRFNFSNEISNLES